MPRTPAVLLRLVQMVSFVASTNWFGDIVPPFRSGRNPSLCVDSGRIDIRGFVTLTVDRARLPRQEDTMRRLSLLTAVVVAMVVGAGLWAQERPAYFLVKVAITDQDAYGAYRAGFGSVFHQYFLVAIQTHL